LVDAWSRWSFPTFYTAWDYLKYGMNLRGFYKHKFSEAGWIALFQLARQVLQLIIQLSGCYRYFPYLMNLPQIMLIKMITPAKGFGIYLSEIIINRADWVGLGSKPQELRVMKVTACLTLQDLACQQRFTPKGHQAFSIQIRRVQTPQTHGWRLSKLS
jgi:hypothetical protein